MSLSHVAPISITTLLLWLCIPCYGQYDPFREPPYYGEPEPPFAPYFTPPEVPPPQAQPPQQVYPPFVPTNTNSNANLFNPFLLTGQQSQNQQNLQQVQQIQKQQQLLQQQLQQLQGSYPNLPSVPFQTVSPSNPLQRVDKYPFQPPTNTLGNVGSANNNLNSLSSLQQQQSFGNTLLSQQYPKLPDLPFQTISPGQVPPFNNNNFNLYKSRVELPKIRVIEFPSSEYFEYGGGKLVQPKRPNSDLYVGGVGGDVPITSKIFIECTGPNQVEWIKNGTEKKDLSVITKSFQITIPEERGPTPGSREYTYLRLGLEENISEKDAGVYLCRDRILPQNYISIRVIVPSPPPTGKPNYPFIRPKDPNTIYFSRRDSSVVLPCKIENADATISLHKHESGKFSCPFTVGDGRVSYDRFKGFIIQTRSFRDLEGRYVCVGDFNGDLRLMKYKLVNSEDFTTRYVEGEAQNVIALDTSKNAGGDSSTAGSSFLAQTDSFSNSILSGLTGSGSISNLTAAGLLDPRILGRTGSTVGNLTDFLTKNMEGFSISPAGLFQPQPGCLSCVQVKQRLDVIENYLLLKNPDFAHLRNYISTVSSAPATYDLGCGPAQNFSTSATISVREYDPTALGSSVTPTCLPYNTLGSQGVTGNNILQNGVGPGVPMEATKARRKQTLVKKPTSPSNVKRRGRKRKYPIETPNSAMAPPNLQHLHPGSNGIVKIVVPIKTPTSAAASVAHSSGTNMPRTQMEGFNVGGEMRTRVSQMSSLDVLAAVSYVLKNNLGNGSVAAAVANSGTPRDLYSAPKSYLNQGQGQGTYHLHQENGSPSKHNDMPKDVNAQKTLEQELGQPVLVQHQKNYSDSNPTPGGNLFQGSGETLLSPSRSSHTADSQDEYNAIVTEAPATEITI